jgi:hypothetical protein
MSRQKNVSAENGRETSFFSQKITEFRYHPSFGDRKKFGPQLSYNIIGKLSFIVYTISPRLL